MFTFFFTFMHSDANLHDEDHNFHTPIMTSAVQKQVTAFQHFMKYVDLKDSERNPIFKTLCVKWKQAEILEVCLLLCNVPVCIPTLILHIIL